MRITALALLALLGGSAPPAVPADDAAPVPRNLVAFVRGDACPPGWATDTLAAGRILVGTDDAELVGRVVGEALGPEEDRVHFHDLDGATIDLPHKSISAADGGNQQGAGAGAQPVTGDVMSSTSGLPFVELRTCRSP